MKQLIKDYRKSIRKLKTYRSKMSQEQLDEDGPIVDGMISDLRFSVEWMKTGKRPGSRRGIENQSYEQRTIPLNPLILQSYEYESSGGTHIWVDQEQRKMIDQALSKLTEKEREVYVMAYGQGMTHKEISRLLNIQRGTVGVMMKRAKKKIQAYVSKMEVS